MVVEEVEYEDTDSETPRGNSADAADEQLHHILRGLRKDFGRKYNLPPYVIFQDSSLAAMATTYPVTMGELYTIPGVGVGKAHRYGREFVEVIKKYVEENDIVRPEDFRMRVMPTRNNRTVQIIQSIDRKIDLEEIADTVGVDFTDLVGELESIVETGTKIDIEYYLNEIFDEDQEQEIFDFFRTWPEDDIEAAIQHLGNEYDEDDIRLVRVRFLSEMAN